MADDYEANNKKERLLGGQQITDEPVYMHALYSPQLEGYEQKRYEAFMNGFYFKKQLFFLATFFFKFLNIKKCFFFIDDDDYNKFQYTLF